MSQPSHPLERLREQRGSAAFLLRSDAGSAGAVAVSSDGWLLTTADATGTVLGGDGVAFPVTKRVADPATGALFLHVDARIDPVPFAVPEERYVGEPLALLVPGGLPGETDVLGASLVAVRDAVTGDGPQSSDVAPSVVRIQVAGTPANGTPAFSLDGQLVGIVRDAGPAGTVDLIPGWSLRTGVDRVLANGTIPRASLGLTGHPAELTEPGTNGFRVDANGVTRGSPAASGGIDPGDVVESVGTALVGPDGSLGDLLLSERPGDTVSLGVRTGTKLRTLEVTLGSTP